MSEVKQIGKLSPEQINALKQEHKCAIFEVSVQVNDDQVGGDTAFFYIKQPNRNVSAAAAKHVKESNFLKGNQLLINSCVVGGAKDLLKEKDEDIDDSIYFTVLNAIGELASKKEHEVKKY